MRVWMKLTREQFDVLKSIGKLTADQARQVQDREDEAAYHWIAEELEKSVSRPEECRYPVTVWYQAEGKKFVKGIRRSPEEATEVLVTLEIPEQELKLFDGNLFRYVEKGQYIPFNEMDKKRYEQVLQRLNLEDDAESLQEAAKKRRQDSVAECLRRMVTDSWYWIFDTRREDDFLFGSNSKKTIQAALWQVRLDQVKRVEYL